MRSLSHAVAAVLLFGFLAGCGGSPKIGSAPGKPSVDQARTPDEQVAVLVAQYEELSQEEKVGEKGQQLIAQLKAMTGDLSENARLLIKQTETSYYLAKLSVAIHKLDPANRGIPLEVLPPPRFGEPEVLPPPRVQGAPGPAN